MARKKIRLDSFRCNNCGAVLEYRQDENLFLSDAFTSVRITRIIPCKNCVVMIIDTRNDINITEVKYGTGN